MVSLSPQTSATAAAIGRPPIAWLGQFRGLPLLPLAILVPFVLIAVFADYIAPYDPTEPVAGMKIFIPPAWMQGGDIRRHILPNVLNSAMVLASLTIGVVIIAEASLSFLGVGVPPPEPAWGSMLADGRSMLMVGAWWLTVLPGLCIMMVVLATQLLGDWLRIRLDPQLRNL